MFRKFFSIVKKVAKIIPIVIKAIEEIIIIINQDTKPSYA
jgi:hypothetical protein